MGRPFDVSCGNAGGLLILLGAYLTFFASQKRQAIGGAEEDRTPDLLRARQALSQLSYGPRKIRIQEKEF